MINWVVERRLLQKCVWCEVINWWFTYLISIWSICELLGRLTRYCWIFLYCGPIEIPKLVKVNYVISISPNYQKMRNPRENVASILTGKFLFFGTLWYTWIIPASSELLKSMNSNFKYFIKSYHIVYSDISYPLHLF